MNPNNNNLIFFLNKADTNNTLHNLLSDCSQWAILSKTARPHYLPEHSWYPSYKGWVNSRLMWSHTKNPLQELFEPRTTRRGDKSPNTTLSCQHPGFVSPSFLLNEICEDATNNNSEDAQTGDGHLTLWVGTLPGGCQGLMSWNTSSLRDFLWRTEDSDSCCA